MSRASRMRAFTLVELLVVIGIIAVLISVLLPAMRKARQAAQSVSCLSSLKQIGAGVIAYASSTGGLMPSGQWGNWTSDGDAVFWYTLINPYVGGKGDTRNTTTALTPSTLSKVFNCSSATVKRGQNHYTSNPILMGRKDEYVLSPGIPHLRLTRQRNSSRLVLVLDGVQNTTSGETSAVAFMMDAGSPFWGRFGTGGISNNQRYRPIPLELNAEGTGTPPLGMVRWRHMNNLGVNAVFADGHAEATRQGYLTEDNFFPQGWRSKP